MKTIMLQRMALHGGGSALRPFSVEDEEFLAEFKPNQTTVWKCVSKGARKQRSYDQLKLFMAAIRVVVANTEDPNWNTVDKAKLSLKVALSFIDPSGAVVGPDGSVVLNYRSFGYEDLKHMEACRVFDRAWPILAGVIGVSEQDLIESAKQGDY